MLTIRKMRKRDFDPLYSLLSDPEVMRFLEPPYTEEKTRAFLKAAMSDTPPVYAAELDGVFIGYVIYHAFDEDSVEIGWVLAREYWGKGYASALTKRMIGQARHEGKSVVIECDPAQEITKRIALRHGFTPSGSGHGPDIYRLSSCESRTK